MIPSTGMTEQHLVQLVHNDIVTLSIEVNRYTMYGYPQLSFGPHHDQ